MRIKTGTAAAMLTIGAMLASSGMGHTAPEPAAAAGVNYTAEKIDNSAVIRVDAGSLVVDKDQFQVVSGTGDVLASLPLTYNLDGKSFPIEAAIDGNTAKLTPVTDPARATAAPIAAPAADIAEAQTRAERDKEAFTKMDAQVRFAVTMGAIVGAVVAGTVGCVVGGIVAVPTAVLTAVFGPLAGCVAGALVMAPVGAIGGTLFVAAPVAVASVIQYLSTVNAAMPVVEPTR
ncbi:hypothetical protein [Nocardia salmonicida]|uniref:hypothetical protein n=1 Tax=Nocardia salmonicida TaxID=53431 RepID=UPI002E2D6925|nr:hypothetical protein [Nocardia salmonicida]